MTKAMVVIFFTARHYFSLTDTFWYTAVRNCTLPIMDELIFVLLCVSFLLADSITCQFMVVHDGFLQRFVMEILRIFRNDWVDCRDTSRNVLCLQCFG